jgi:hypothetical protein
MNKDQLQALARDLRKTPRRSPRETLGGFVIAARMLDKARADLLGIGFSDFSAFQNRSNQV